MNIAHLRRCRSRALLPLVASLLVTACVSVPQQQVTVSGAVPTGQTYAIVQPDKDAPPLATAVGLADCLREAGLTAGVPAQLLTQTAYTLRPARAAVLRADEDVPRRGPKPSLRRDREVLVVTLTDRATGAVRWRGAVTRLLGKGETAGDGRALVAPLCGALRSPLGAASG